MIDTATPLYPRRGRAARMQACSVAGDTAASACRTRAWVQELHFESTPSKMCSSRHGLVARSSQTARQFVSCGLVLVDQSIVLLTSPAHRVQPFRSRIRACSSGPILVRTLIALSPALRLADRVRGFRTAPAHERLHLHWLRDVQAALRRRHGSRACTTIATAATQGHAS